jgi:sensor histidine kinase YesM
MTGATKKIVRFSFLVLIIIFTENNQLLAGVDYNLLNRARQITTTYMVTGENTLDYRDVISTGLDDRFIPLKRNVKISARQTYWLRLDFEDADLSGSEEWIIRFFNYDEITLFYSYNDIILSKTGGKLKRNEEEGDHSFNFFNIHTSDLIDGRYLYARINHAYRTIPLSPPHYWHPHLLYINKHYLTWGDYTFFAFFLLFIGGMMLMVFYSLGIFFMYRDSLFIYYAVYLFALVLYLGVRLPHFFGMLEMKYPILMSIYNDVIQVIVNISYLYFAAVFLNARNDFPKLNTAIRYAIVLLTGVIGFQCLFYLSENYAPLSSELLQLQRYFMIAFTLAAYVHILKNYKSRMVFFLLTGSFFFLIGAVAAMVFINITYMMLGTAIEVFIFSLGMGYRIKLSESEKQGIENEINRVKLIALRAQMNPHFIFNSLNAIRAYVISSDTRKASDYLQKFSYLIRLILQYSSQDTISLKNELEALKLYIQLEQLRFRESFNFSLTVPEGFNPEIYRIPPLILQPYVENAIIHGLVPKKGDKSLAISIKSGSTSVWISIIDNGVGRSFTKNIRKYNGIEHESMALELTQKRIELAGDTDSDTKKISIVDLTENGRPAGTEVCIKLPLMNQGLKTKNQLS